MEFEALRSPWHNDMDGMRRGLWDCGIAVIDLESQPGVTAASFAGAQGDSGRLRRLQQGQLAKFRVSSDYLIYNADPRQGISAPLPMGKGNSAIQSHQIMRNKVALHPLVVVPRCMK
jgi:hypothetical protein